MTRYKFTAEIKCDADLFFRTLGERAKNTHTEYIYNDAPRYGSYGAFDSELSIEELLAIAADCTDCHYIERTLNREAEFTGEWIRSEK